MSFLLGGRLVWCCGKLHLKVILFFFITRQTLLRKLTTLKSFFPSRRKPALRKIPKIQCRVIDPALQLEDCGPVVRTFTLKFGNPGLKTSSAHWLNLFLVVPGSTSQLHL